MTASDLGATVARIRKQFLQEFDPAYVDNVIVPHFLLRTYKGERPWLPMIDVTLTKENALPYDLRGMLSESWKHRRKRICMSAATPDLYRPMYGEKVDQFVDQLLDGKMPVNL